MADLYCTGCAHKLADHVKVKRIEGRQSRVVYRCIGAVATSGHCACTGYSGPVVDQWKERALKAERIAAVAGDLWNEIENLREHWENTPRATFIQEYIDRYEKEGLA